MDTLVSLLRLAGSFVRKHLGALVDVARAGWRWLRSKLLPAREAVTAIAVKLIRRTLGRRASMPPDLSSVPPQSAPSSTSTTTTTSSTTNARTARSTDTTSPNAPRAPIAWSALIARVREKLSRPADPPMDAAA